MIYRAPNKLSQEECGKVANELNEILDHGDDVIIDLNNTEYISSAGIRTLVLYLKVFRAKGYDFSIVNPSDMVRKIFRVTGLDNILLVSEEDEKEYKRK